MSKWPESKGHDLIFSNGWDMCIFVIGLHFYQNDNKDKTSIPFSIWKYCVHIFPKSKVLYVLNLVGFKLIFGYFWKTCAYLPSIIGSILSWYWRMPVFFLGRWVSNQWVWGIVTAVITVDESVLFRDACVHLCVGNTVSLLFPDAPSATGFSRAFLSVMIT